METRYRYLVVGHKEQVERYKKDAEPLCKTIQFYQTLPKVTQEIFHLIPEYTPIVDRIVFKDCSLNGLTQGWLPNPGKKLLWRGGPLSTFRWMEALREFPATGIRTVSWCGGVGEIDARIAKLIATFPIENLELNSSDDGFFTSIARAMGDPTHLVHVQELNLYHVTFTNSAIIDLSKIVGRIRRILIQDAMFLEDGDGEGPPKDETFAILRQAISASKTLHSLWYRDVDNRMIPRRWPTELEVIRFLCTTKCQSTACGNLLRTIDGDACKLSVFDIECSRVTPDIVQAIKSIPLAALRRCTSIRINLFGATSGVSDRFTRLLHAENRVKKLGLTYGGEVISLFDIVRSPYCGLHLLSGPQIFATPVEEYAFIHAVRAESAITDLAYPVRFYPLAFRKALHSMWFRIIQAILSTRYIPRLSSSRGADQIPWGDYIGTIAHTLGWGIEELSLLPPTHPSWFTNNQGEEA